MNHSETARALFLQGYNCAQSVAGAFSTELDLPFDVVVRLASSFGGGMGRMREVCGAVSGMFLVAGMLYGYDDPNDFWKEVTIASKKYKMDPILSYMYMVLKKSKDGLKYENLKALGKDVEFYPGVKEYFQRINEYGKQFDL